MPNGSIQGTYVRTELDWLAAHAMCDEQKVYRCKTTEERIRSIILHRCKADCSGPDAPYLEEHKWAEGSGSVSGTAITFATLWCPSCDGNFDRHPTIKKSELICVGC